MKKTVCLHAPFKLNMDTTNIVPSTTLLKYLRMVHQENLGIFVVGGGKQDISAVAS